jgi:hypothetical protein
MSIKCGINVGESTASCASEILGNMVSLRVEPKIPALCNFKTSKNYKKAGQTRVSS